MVLKVYGQSNTKDTDCCSDTAVFLFHGIDFESPPPNKRQVSRDAKYTRRQAFPVRWYNFIGGRMQVYFEGIYQFNRATYPQTMPKKVDKRSWHNSAKRDTMSSSQTFPAVRILLQPAIQTISAPKSVPEFFCSLHKHFRTLSTTKRSLSRFNKNTKRIYNRFTLFPEKHVNTRRTISRSTEVCLSRGAGSF